VEKIGLDLRIVGQGFDLLPVERPAADRQAIWLNKIKSLFSAAMIPRFWCAVRRLALARRTPFRVFDVDRELQSTAQVRGVAFDTKELISWDSSVLAFLVELSELCAQRALYGRGFACRGAPAFALAEAVPKKKGARKEEAEISFLQRVAFRPSAPATLWERCSTSSAR